MRSLTSTAIVAIVAGAIGFATLTPAAFAQEGPSPGQPGGNQMQMHDQMQMQMPGHFGNHRIERRNNRNNGVRSGALLDLVCADNGAERTEIGFVRLSYRLELTPEQQTLFDDLRSSALTAQTQYADQCSKPGAPDAAAADAQPVPPTPVERLTAQIGNDTVRLELLQGLLPKLDAFYNSLTDEQKATLMPERGADNGNGFRNRHHGHMPGMPGMPGSLATWPPARCPPRPIRPHPRLRPPAQPRADRPHRNGWVRSHAQ